MASNLGPDLSKSLSAFLAFTGCDDYLLSIALIREKSKLSNSFPLACQSIKHLYLTTIRSTPTHKLHECRWCKESNLEQQENIVQKTIRDQSNGIRVEFYSALLEVSQSKNAANHLHHLYVCKATEPACVKWRPEGRAFWQHHDFENDLVVDTLPSTITEISRKGNSWLRCRLIGRWVLRWIFRWITSRYLLANIHQYLLIIKLSQIRRFCEI